MEISFSQLRVYLECPWQYKLRFLDGRRPPQTAESALGISLHRALESYYRDSAGDASLERLLDCFERRRVRPRTLDPKEDKVWADKGKRILKRCFELEADRRSQVAGVEREFTYPLGRHSVRGMIDRIDLLPDGGHEIIDYKTWVGTGGGAAEDSPARSLQLRFYALGAKESLAMRPAVLTIIELSTGKILSVPYDPAGEDELKALIVNAAEGIERGALAPETSFCPRCAFKADCSNSTAA